MSYDLAFWRERPGQRLPPQEVYERLLAEQPVEWLEPVDMERFLSAMADAFPDGVREPHGPRDSFVWVGAGSMFEVSWSVVHVIVTMRPLEKQTVNRVIEIAAARGMALYDPQTGERFAQLDP